MQKERCVNATLATVYKILHKLIMSVESSKNIKKKKLFHSNDNICYKSA